MSWMDIPEEMEKEIDAGAYEYKESVGSSGLYKVVIDKAYTEVNPNTGSVAFNVVFKSESNRLFFMKEYTKSGAEKGNKSTYTNKKGKEVPLPGVTRVMKLFKTVGVNVKTKTKKGFHESFGKEVEVTYFPELESKKLVVVIESYEDDYTGEIKIKNDFIDFLNLDYTDGNGKDKKEYYEDRFEKQPVRPLRVKKNKDSSGSGNVNVDESPEIPF